MFQALTLIMSFTDLNDEAYKTRPKMFVIGRNPITNSMRITFDIVHMSVDDVGEEFFCVSRFVSQKRMLVISTQIGISDRQQISHSEDFVNDMEDVGDHSIIGKTAGQYLME